MLIVLSGIDGCGKTLQVNLLQRRLTEEGFTSVVTKAYDDMAKVACRPFIESWTDDVAITFLFQALHAQQHAVTLEALKKADVVIADRWDESYLAYHGNFGFLAGQEDLRAMLNKLAFRELVPDFGFVIEVPVEVARRRRESRGAQERFEDRSDDYYRRIQETYCDIAGRRGWSILDGTKTPAEIHAEILRVLAEKLHSMERPS